MNHIFGNQALLVTPMHRDGSIDEGGLRNMLDWVIAEGAHGVLMLGSTGESFALTPEERERVIKISGEQVRGRVPLGIGAADTGTRQVIRLAQCAEEYRADYLLIPPPYYAPGSMNTSDGVLQFFKEIADATKLGLMLYDGGSGIEIPLDTIRRLAVETKNIRAIKVNVASPGKVTAIRDAGLRAFCGTDALTLLMMRYGADGYTLGVGNLLPAHTSALYDRCRNDDWDGARAVYYDTLLPLINVTITSLPQYIACFKTILHEKGIIGSRTVRRPLLPLDEVRCEETLAVAKRIGLL